MRLHAALMSWAAGRQEVHCVGGCVRDRLLGRPAGDLDIIVPGAIRTARAFANAAGAAFVVLDAKRGTARVVDLADRAVHIDFNEPLGDLLTDLRQRDFTINAIACSLATWATPQPDWIDPTGGLADLASRRLRVCGPTSLPADPVRILRGHRFAVQLGLDIEPVTAAQITAVGPALAEAASERVLQEWVPLLAADEVDHARRAGSAAEVLALLLPGGWTGQLLLWVEPLLVRLRNSVQIGDWLAEDETRAMVRFALLLAEGRPAPPDLVRRFALSRAHRRILEACAAPWPTKRSTLAAVAALVVERGLAASGTIAVQAALGRWDALHLEQVETVLAEVLGRWAAAPLVTGDDLGAELGLTAGPRYAPVLRRVREAQLTGEVSDRATALELARRTWDEHG